MDSTEKLHGVNHQDSPRPAKPLGRGLQDLSHLFLPQGTNPSHPANRSEGDAATSEHTTAQPESRPSSLLLKSCAPANRNTVTKLLTDLEGGFEAGLRVIDTGLPCSPYGQIDLLALDRSNQLVIIDFEINECDGLLLRGMSHFDWAVHNVFNIRRMYALETINLLAEPKLVLLAPQFSDVLHSVGRHINSPKIDFIRYHVADVGGGVGILFERVTP